MTSEMQSEPRHKFDMGNVRVFAAEYGFHPGDGERVFHAVPDDAVPRILGEMPDGGVLYGLASHVELLRDKWGAYCADFLRQPGREAEEESIPAYTGLGFHGQNAIQPTPEPEPGPILEVDDRGRVGLYLERLSGEREAASCQMIAAEGEALICGHAELYRCLNEAREFVWLGWPIASRLDRIREAHRALCVEQCKAATEVAR